MVRGGLIHTVLSQMNGLDVVLLLGDEVLKFSLLGLHKLSFSLDFFHLILHMVNFRPQKLVLFFKLLVYLLD
jgi:hypothetical protein